MKKMGVTPRPFRSRLLVFVPLLAALYMFVWPTAHRFFTKPPDAPLMPPFTNHLVTSDFWATFPPVAVAVPFLFICGFMTVYFLGSKGFCTYACPYGGFFVLADKVAPGKIRVTDACNQCGHCTAVCTSNVLVHAEVKAYGMVVDPGCMKCMDCVSVCPNDALYFGFGKPSIAVPQAAPKRYSLTWPEEVAALAVFAASFWAVWDVYQLVPMLMALGSASITTFLALTTAKLLRARDFSFHRFDLKASGRMRGAGWGFAGLRAAVDRLECAQRLGAPSRVRGRPRLRGHPGARRAGAGAGESRSLAQPDRPPEHRLREEASSRRQGCGVVREQRGPPEARVARVSLRQLEGCRRSARPRPPSTSEGRARALSLYYRGAILNRLGRQEEALASLDQALAERSDLVLAREERGESLWRLGRRQEAVSAWRDAVGSNAGLVLANNLLAGAAAVVGRPEAAIAHERQADQSTPDDPFFHWMVGLRLQHVGMAGLAEKHFQRAIAARSPDSGHAGTRSRCSA